MAAEPAYNTVIGRAYALPIEQDPSIEQFQRPFCIAKRYQDFATVAPGGSAEATPNTHK